MPDEIQQLKEKVQLLENILFSFIRSDRFDMSKNIQMQDGRNIQLATGTGTKIATGSTQKLGFFNATPIVQPSSTGETTGFTAGSGTAVRDDSIFTGNTGSTAYRISDIIRHLKLLGLLAS